MAKSNSSGGGFGCVSVIAAGIFIWALVFGVTIDGKHYGLSGCDTSKGVTIDPGK